MDKGHRGDAEEVADAGEDFPRPNRAIAAFEVYPVCAGNLQPSGGFWL